MGPSAQCPIFSNEATIDRLFYIIKDVLITPLLLALYLCRNLWRAVLALMAESLVFIGQYCCWFLSLTGCMWRNTVIMCFC